MQNCKSIVILIEARALNLIVSNPRQATKQEVKAYQSIIGSLTYLATQTRTDIAFIYLVLSQFLINPSKDY